MSTDPAIDPVTLEELRQLARTRPRSGRQAAAKAYEIRTLERLAREGRRQPIPPMPEAWYPHEPGDPFYELDWEFLHEHPHILEALGAGVARGECEVRWFLYSRSPTASRAWVSSAAPALPPVRSMA